MQYKPLHCWDCGARVIEDDGNGQYTALPTFRQVKFGLSAGAYCESPFCTQCANVTWTQDRAKQFERAVNAVDPRNQIHVLTVEGIGFVTVPILGIVTT